MLTWQLILIVLCIIVLELAALIFVVMRALRNLSEKRLQVYIDYFTYLNKYAYAWLNDCEPPKVNHEADAAFVLIASIPTFEAGNDVLDAIADLGECVNKDSDPNETSAARENLNKVLEKLNVQMRDDLRLNSLHTRFANIWSNRSTWDK